VDTTRGAQRNGGGAGGHRRPAATRASSSGGSAGSSRPSSEQTERKKRAGGSRAGGGAGGWRTAARPKAWARSVFCTTRMASLQRPSSSGLPASRATTGKMWVCSHHHPPRPPASQPRPPAAHPQAAPCDTPTVHSRQQQPFRGRGGSAAPRVRFPSGSQWVQTPRHGDPIGVLHSRWPRLGRRSLRSWASGGRRRRWRRSRAYTCRGSRRSRRHTRPPARCMPPPPPPPPHHRPVEHGGQRSTHRPRAACWQRERPQVSQLCDAHERTALRGGPDPRRET
jgi:hypothetical protein